MALIQTAGGVMDVEQVGQGRDLVLLHSLLTDRTAFARVQPLLAPRHRLWLVNLPGYGRSAPAGPEVEDCADRIAALLEALALPPETDVLGNGLGGFIAQALAIRHGSRFARLVIVDSLAGFPEAGKEPLRRLAAGVQANGMAAALDAAIARMFPPAYIQAHPDVVAERKRDLLQMDPGVFASLCLALTRVDFKPRLASIRNRTLVIAGALDQTTATPLVRELAAGIPGARFQEIADAGHCPQIEQPDALARHLGAFLDGRGA